MSLLEAVAVAFGIVSVWLSVKESIWSWPTAIVNVSLYFVIFFQQRFYADMGLQVFYAAISLYGWYHWLFGGEYRTVLSVTRTPRGLWMILPVLWLYDYEKTVNQDHGRIEIRECWTISDPEVVRHLRGAAN